MQRTQRRSKLRKEKPSVKFPQAQTRSTARSRPRVAPDEFDVPLTYRKTGNINTGDGIYYMKFNPNCAYDVDPSLASTETYGFDEYAHLYSYYRVISYKYVITLANMNSDDNLQALGTYVVNTNTDPTIDGTRFDLYSTNPHCQSALLSSSASGGARHVFRKNLRCSTVAGDPTVETADSYRSLVDSVPVDKLWLTFAFESLNSNANMHLAYDVIITMNVRFYARKNDLSLATIASRINQQLADRERYNLQKRLMAPPVPNPEILAAWKVRRQIK